MTEPAHGSGRDQGGLAEEHAPVWNASPRATESLEDPKAYRAFVKGLYAKVEPSLAKPLSAEAQIEFAELARLLATMPRKSVDEHRAAFETAFDLLATGTSNILVVRSIRHTLATVQQKHSSLLARLLLRVCGDTPITAVLAALVTAFALSFVFVFIFAFAREHWLAASTTAEALPLLSVVSGNAAAEIMLLIHAAFIGSIVSVIVRVRSFMRPARAGPLLLYVSVLTKPFVATTFALLAYAMLKAGMVSSMGVDLAGPQAPYLVWAVGFLCGFSERFAQDFVMTASTELSDPRSPLSHDAAKDGSR